MTIDPAAVRAVHDEILKQAVDNGQLIAAGFAAHRAAIMPNAPEAVIDVMRVAYMSGAQHLFASIMSILDSDREPTMQALKRMSLIDSELQAFAAETAQRVGLAAGLKNRDEILRAAGLAVSKRGH
jgi:hypothetical protein